MIAPNESASPTPNCDRRSAWPQFSACCRITVTPYRITLTPYHLHRFQLAWVVLSGRAPTRFARTKRSAKPLPKLGWRVLAHQWPADCLHPCQRSSPFRVPSRVQELRDILAALQ